MNILVFDIGATSTRVAFSSNGQTITRKKVYPTPKKYADGLQALVSTFRHISSGKKITRIVGGIAAPLDTLHTKTVHQSSLPGWYRQPFKKDLQRLLRVPIQLENDAAIAGMGEAVSGAGTGQRITAFLTIGTGVGGMRIVDGRFDVSAFGFEPGDMIISQYRGKITHLEHSISGSGLARQHGREARHIIQRKIWSEVERQLALALVNITVLWSPNIIVISGSVGRSSSIHLPRIRALYRRHLTVFHTPPRIVRGRLGDDAGLYGALALTR